MCQGQDFLTKDGPEVVVSGRESIITDPDVRGEICVMPDQLSVVVPKSAVVPLAVSVVAQTRPRGGGGSDLLLPVEYRTPSFDGFGASSLCGIGRRASSGGPGAGVVAMSQSG